MQTADWADAQRLLPSLASSLAYQRYKQWQQDSGGAEVADVVPGVTLERLYQQAEREVGGGVLPLGLLVRGGMQVRGLQHKQATTQPAALHTRVHAAASNPAGTLAGRVEPTLIC